MEISKRDWKLFREKLSGWQENYMERLNQEYILLLSAEGKDASEKFWELEKRIKKDKRHPGVFMAVSYTHLWNKMDMLRVNPLHLTLRMEVEPIPIRERLRDPL